MAEFMHDEVVKKVKEMIMTSSHLALICKVTTIDNVNYMSVHAYMMVDCDWVSILISLEHVTKGGESNNLIKIIVRKIV
jgi:hypothetical protein